jgi:hypothetical protein
MSIFLPLNILWNEPELFLLTKNISQLRFLIETLSQTSPPPFYDSTVLCWNISLEYLYLLTVENSCRYIATYVIYWGLKAQIFSD